MTFIFPVTTPWGKHKKRPNCIYCGGGANKSIVTKTGLQKYYCKICGKTWVHGTKSKRPRLMSEEKRILHYKMVDKKSNQKSRSILKKERLRVIDILGGECFVCGGKERRLELHHLTYRNGDPYKENVGDKRGKAIIKEALYDPENFVVLCTFDHGIITRVNSKKERFMELIKLS